jgi:hypothetical protein
MPESCWFCETKFSEGDITHPVDTEEHGEIHFCTLCHVSHAPLRSWFHPPRHDDPGAIVQDTAAMLNVVLARMSRLEERVIGLRALLDIRAARAIPACQIRPVRRGILRWLWEGACDGRGNR